MRSLRSTLTLAAGSIAAFALVLASPPMVSTADGCSGATSYPVDNPSGKWASMEYVDGQTVPMDGVVVLRGKRHSSSASNSGAVAVTVSVTDALAQPVAGKTWVEPGDGEWPATSHVVWRPNAPLQAGAGYTVDWHVQNLPYGVHGAFDGSAMIVASNGISVLADLESTAPQLQRTNALTGERVECDDSSECNVPPFGTSEIQPYGMRFSVLPPTDPNTFQALSVREVPGKGTFEQTYDTPAPKRLGIMAAPWLDQLEFSVWFVEELPEYCVELVQRDLRNDVERKKELCVTRTELAPSGGVFLKEQLDRCAVQPILPGDAGPAGKDASSPGNDASSPGNDTFPPDSSGCAVAPRSRSPGGLPVAVLLLLAWARRKPWRSMWGARALG